MNYELSTDEVYELVADEPLSTREVSDRLGVPFTAARNHLVKLHTDGRIESTTPRYYNESAKWVVSNE